MAASGNFPLTPLGISPQPYTTLDTTLMKENIPGTLTPPSMPAMPVPQSPSHFNIGAGVIDQSDIFPENNQKEKNVLRTNRFVNSHVYMCVMYVWLMHTYIHTYTHIHTHIHTYTYTYIHTYIHTHYGFTST